MARRRESSEGGGLFIVICLIIWFVVTFFWWIVAAVGLVAAVYIGRALLRARDARRAVARAYCDALAARADQQHQWVLRGDDRGIYGTEGAKLMREIRR